MGEPIHICTLYPPKKFPSSRPERMGFRRLPYEEAKVLNQAVQRNLARFPADFMFRLTPAEAGNLKSQIVTSNDFMIF